jgi:hypothetical protein
LKKKKLVRCADLCEKCIGKYDFCTNIMNVFEGPKFGGLLLPKRNNSNNVIYLEQPCTRVCFYYNTPKEYVFNLKEESRL